MTPMNCKDSESADDESSGDESTPTKNSPAKQKRKSSRIPPEGREKPKLTCSMTRDDESMESIHGVSGSMVDLVKGKINIYARHTGCPTWIAAKVKKCCDYVF